MTFSCQGPALLESKTDVDRSRLFLLDFGGRYLGIRPPHALGHLPQFGRAVADRLDRARRHNALHSLTEGRILVS